MIFDYISQTIVNVVNTFKWIDIIDIALVAYVVYQLLALVRRSRSIQLVRGVIILVIGYILSIELGLKTTKFILDKFLQIGLIAVVIIFQPELRRALERVGRGRISSLLLLTGRFSASEQFATWHEPVASICDSVESMSKKKCGALIVIERTTPLNEIIGTGTVIDSAVAKDLIETIFYEGSPLHDGAMVIRDGRIIAAGCLLPLSQRYDISRSMGTRHRAAIGMSENSDAIILVVSEETGIVSFVHNGAIVRNIDRDYALRFLNDQLMPEEKESENSKKSIWSVFKNEKQ